MKKVKQSADTQPKVVVGGILPLIPDLHLNIGLGGRRHTESEYDIERSTIADMEALLVLAANSSNTWV